MDTQIDHTQITETVTATQARRALGGISRATEFRWTRKGILKPTYIGTTKLYKVSDINSLIEKGSN